MMTSTNAPLHFSLVCIWYLIRRCQKTCFSFLILPYASHKGSCCASRMTHAVSDGVQLASLFDQSKCYNGLSQCTCSQWSVQISMWKTRRVFYIKAQYILIYLILVELPILVHWLPNPKLVWDRFALNWRSVLTTYLIEACKSTEPWRSPLLGNKA